MRAILELTGRDESLIEHVTDRPGHDRRYSLVVRQAARELGWEAQIALRGGPRRAPSTGTATTSGGGSRSARGEYRDYYERQYGRSLG